MVLRIFKMIATRSFLTALECTKFVFDLGSALDPNDNAAVHVFLRIPIVCVRHYSSIGSIPASAAKEQSG